MLVKLGADDQDDHLDGLTLIYFNLLQLFDLGSINCMIYFIVAELDY